MSDGYPLLFGELETSLAVDELAAALAREGLGAETRESVHYAGGRYVRIHAGDVDLTLERIDGAAHIARADAEDDASLAAAAAMVSAALARLGIRHRMELFDAADRMVGYLHHLWPRMMEVEQASR